MCASPHAHSARKGGHHHEISIEPNKFMKGNAMNDKDRLNGSLRTGVIANLVGSNVYRGIRAGVATLVAVMALVMVNGCASVPVQANADPWQYNPDTGYPAGGARPWNNL